MGVAVSNAGDIFVAEYQTHVIRKVTQAGVVTVFAGETAVAGSDDGPHGHFNGPWGLAIDASGNLFVADSGSHTIRKIAVSGAVSTVAGSANLAGSRDDLGTRAQFSTPTGIAVDSAGNLFIAEMGNQTIRKIAPDGAVSTFAGTAGMAGDMDGNGTAAQFNKPQAVAVDASGNVFVVDNGNNAIRKITSSRDVSTVSRDLSNPFAVAVDSTGVLIVTDAVAIKKLMGASVVPFAGGLRPGSKDGALADARFSTMNGVGVTGSGQIVVSDTLNGTIRVVAPSTGVSTLAGAPPIYPTLGGAGFFDPYDLALDGTGNAFVVQRSSPTVREVTPTGVVTAFAGSEGHFGSQDGVGASAWFNYPSGIAVDGSGNVFIPDRDNHTIRKITSAGEVSTLAGKPNELGQANGMGADARFFGPEGVAVDSTGNVFVADTNNLTIRKITPDGTVSTFAGSPGHPGTTDGIAADARFTHPQGIAVDAQGNVYVADTHNRILRKVTPDGTVLTFAGQQDPSGSPGVSVDGTGVAARFVRPFRLAVGPGGDVFVADGALVRRVTADGTVTTVAGIPGLRGVRPGPLPTSLNEVMGIAALPNGNLVVVSEGAVLDVIFHE